MGRLKLIVIIIGAVLVYGGFEERQLAAVAAPEPQTLSLAELEANGPGDNAHIVLTDFLLLEQTYVYTEKKGKWKDVWIPAAPIGGEYQQQVMALFDEDGELREGATLPAPKGIKVIAKLPKARSGADVSRFAEAETMQGMVVNEVDSLGSDEEKLLRESYPDIDFKECWIFEEGRSPTSAGGVAAQIGVGLGLVALGLWAMFGKRRKEAKAEEPAAA